MAKVFGVKLAMEKGSKSISWKPEEHDLSYLKVRSSIWKVESKYAEEKNLVEHYSVSGMEGCKSSIPYVWGGIWESLFYQVFQVTDMIRQVWEIDLLDQWL